MDLIRTVLDLIRDKLNEYLRNTDARPDDWVVLANIVDHDGVPYAVAKDKLVMVLANIKHETIISTYSSTVKTKGSAYTNVMPPLYIDLYILFYANFYDDNYRRGLSMISRTVSFFQQNPLFTSANMPDLPAVMDKLVLEITNLDLLELNYLMGMLGTKYLPSIYYKVRMLPFAGPAIGGVTPPVGGASSTGDAPT